MSELTTEEKRFFATTAISAGNLSNTSEGSGAVLVKEKKLLSIGYNRFIIPEHKETGISAIYDAIFSSRDVDIKGSCIFSSIFPSKEDVKLMVITGIEKVYFLGKINDQETVKLVNIFSDHHIFLDFIQLET